MKNYQTFDQFLNEGKIIYKRGYTDLHPAKSTNEKAAIRNKVLGAIQDGILTEDELNNVIKETGAHGRWVSRNSHYFKMTESGIRLSSYGMKIWERVKNAGAINEGNGFLFALKEAREKGLTEFEYNGKKFQVREKKINEAASVPSNIMDFAKRKGPAATSLVKKAATWAEKAGKRISGGTAIGKNYSTIVLDMKYQGAEIYINLDNETIELFGEEVTDAKSFKKVLDSEISESAIFEAAMADIDILAQESKDFKTFVKEFKKEYKDMDAGAESELEAWLKTVYDSAKENMDESKVTEAFIGPFVFNDRMSDDELTAMYNGALDGYANWQSGFHFPKSDYKQTYQEIEKILKKRGVKVDESIVDENIRPDQIEQAAKDLAYSMPNHTKPDEDGKFNADQVQKAFKYIPDLKYVKDKKDIQSIIDKVLAIVNESEQLNEYTENVFKPTVLDRRNSLDEKFFAKLMPKTAKTTDEAMERIWDFEGGKMFLHLQSFVVMPNGNAKDRPTYRLHQQQYWLNDTQLKMQGRDPNEGVNTTLLTVIDITDGQNESLGSIWVDTKVFLSECKVVFELNEKLNEATYQQDLRNIHFETDPKRQEALKLAYGEGTGEVSDKKKIEAADYMLKKFRKEIKFGDGSYTGVFLPGTYDAITSRLGDGPHAKTVKAKNWNQKEYDKWIDEVGSSGGVEHAFDMARNAKNEPGLIDWVKKNNPGEDPLQRIQYDIEAQA